MGVVDGGLQHLLFYKSSCLLYLHQGKLPWKSSARPMALPVLVKYKVDGDFLSQSMQVHCFHLLLRLCLQQLQSRSLCEQRFSHCCWLIQYDLVLTGRGSNLDSSKLLNEARLVVSSPKSRTNCAKFEFFSSLLKMLKISKSYSRSQDSMKSPKLIFTNKEIDEIGPYHDTKS